VNFSRALQLTIGLLFVRSLLHKVFPEFDNTIIGNAFFSGGVFFAFIFFTVKQYKLDKKETFPSNSKGKRFIRGTIALIVSLFLLTWLTMELEVLIKRGATLYFSNSDEIFAWSLRQRFFLSVLVVSPILEELYFRGLILTSLQRNYSRKRAIILSALLFSLSHIKTDETFISTLLYAFLTGLFYAWLFNKTQDIRASIFAHFLWNLMVYLFPLIMFHSGYKIESLSSFTIFAIILITISVGLLFISIKQFRKE